MMNVLLNWNLVFIASVLLTILSGCILYRLICHRYAAPLDNTRSMFHDLCRVHDLSRRQRKLLQRLANGLKLSSPSALFVDSSLWRIPEDGAGGQELTKKEWDKLLILRRVLFLPAPVRPH